MPGKRRVKAFWLFDNLQNASYDSRIVQIGSNHLYLSGIKTISKDGIKFVIIASYNREHNALIKYKEQWQIETIFKAMESSGFNMEDTHLTDINRLSKMIGVICIAFIWAYQAGIFRHENEKPIRDRKSTRLNSSH